MEKNNIVLIGMPASGKSTLGVVLAKMLGYNFLDCDLVIQKRTKKKLYEILNEVGVNGFIEIENDACSHLDDEIEHNLGTIISTGGSVVYGKDAMEYLKKMGTIVYLKVSYENIKKRLDKGDFSTRGVVIKKGNTLKELYDERIPLYEKYADIVIDEEGSSQEDMINKLKEIFIK